MTATTYTPIAARLRQIPRAIRRLAVATALVMLVVVIAAMGTGASYAFWNGSVPSGATTVSTGSIDLRVNGQETYMVPDLMTTALLPGRSVTASQPLVLSNTGSVPLAITWTGTSITSASSSLQSSLMASVRPATASTCSVTAQSSPLATTLPAMTIQPGATARLCLEVRMSSSAPADVQGQQGSIAISLEGTQVRS